MRSVGLITDPSVTLESFRAALEREFAVTITEVITGVLTLVIRDGRAYALLDALGDGPEQYEEYEAGELSVVGLDRMTFFDLRYRSIAFLKRVLQAVADDPRVWVDNDNGMILTGPELVARLRREPEWLMGLPTMTGD